MKKLVSLALFCTLTLNMFAQIHTETKTEKIERMQWWTEARFGMFIHWGLYALPARHEWVMSNEKMSSAIGPIDWPANGQLNGILAPKNA